MPEEILYEPATGLLRVVSRSDDRAMLVFDDKGGVREVPTPDGKAILDEPRVRRLADAVTRVRRLFPGWAVVDVEWVLEGERVWIVQARPFVEPSQAAARE